MNIAIDGPAGAGKSTIAEILAEKLKLVHIDTGAMYRAVGLKAYLSGVASSDEKGVETLLSDTRVDIVFDGDKQRVILDGRDVSREIREHRISAYASDVSRFRAVRVKMAELQRVLARRADSVLDGRDIGTYVLPDADFKFFVTAALDERAKRRYNELKAKGADCDLAAIKRDIALRDANDASRALAPLKKADDSVEIDTTKLSITEAVETILALVKQKLPKKGEV
jgi:cytidylate kinase